MNRYKKAFRNALCHQYRRGALICLAQAMFDKPDIDRTDVYEFFSAQFDEHIEECDDVLIFKVMDFIAGLNAPEEHF